MPLEISSPGSVGEADTSRRMAAKQGIAAILRDAAQRGGSSGQGSKITSLPLSEDVRSGRFARGPAYAQTDAPHLLNVRSVNMSALPDDPSHFERWLAEQTQAWSAEVQVTEAGTFATRRLYGRYLRALLYEEMTLSGG